MDGVGGLTQPHIKPGKTYVYEFTLQQHGTHMYHPHADEMVQMAMGMMGLFVIHPKDPRQHAGRPRLRVPAGVATISSRAAPRRAPPRCRTSTCGRSTAASSRDRSAGGAHGDRVRIRIGNLTMTNHPIHMHGPTSQVTGTDGGGVPPSARWPEVTTDVAVGQTRAIEFVAVAGDWAFHCHKSHHTMNAMGHDVPNMIGVDHRGVAERIAKLLPDYMAMGEKGMADMRHGDGPPGEHPADDDGRGPFGPWRWAACSVSQGARRGQWATTRTRVVSASAASPVADEYRGDLQTPARAPAPRQDKHTNAATCASPPAATPAIEVCSPTWRQNASHEHPARHEYRIGRACCSCLHRCNRRLL